MSNFENPQSSGDAQDAGSEQGSPSHAGGGSAWTPPPPPPDWNSAPNGWDDRGGWPQPGGWPPGGEGQSRPDSAPSGGPPPGGPAAGGGYYAPRPGATWDQQGRQDYPYWGQPQPGWGPGGPGGPGYRGPGGPGGWYGWSPARPRRSLPSAITALLLVVAVLVGLGIGHGVWRTVHNSTNASQGSGNSGNFGLNPFGLGNGNNGSGNSPNAALNGAAATVANELVDIDTTLGYPGYQQGAAAGTGIVLSSDGYVLTNNHVISGSSTVKATDIANGHTYTATVVGYDRTHDVALIKLKGASGLKTADIGDSSSLTVNQPVVGLGNAGGVGGTPSAAAGQIVALHQSITAQDESNGTSEKLTNLIETNANIQPGDSGGALIDSSGHVIGMDTAASTGFSFQTQGNQGFAIPINEAVSIADQIRHGNASATRHIGPTAFLGVIVDTAASASGLQGAPIRGAIPNTPAAGAGLGDGDLITSLGGSTVDSANTLTTVIGHYHPGDKVQVGWTDPSGQSHQATVTLVSGPAA